MMLTFALPAARVVMVDRDTGMNLAHLIGPMETGQLAFYNIDINTDLLRLVRQHTAAESGRRAILIGTHLCGALSPRLISVFQQCSEINSLVLSPCCLKGWLGKQVQARAKQQGRDHYKVLCEELAGMLGADRELCVAVVYDIHVLSPKNGYILAYRNLDRKDSATSTLH